MARVEINETAETELLRRLPGASVEVRRRSDNALVPVWSAETGGTSVSTAPQITTDSMGRIEGWVEPGSYNLIVSKPGFTPWTQPYEAVSGSTSVASTVITVDAPGDAETVLAGPFQAAYDAALAVGGEVYIGAGTYLVDDPTSAAVIKLAPGTTPKVKVRLDPGAVIKLSANTPRFIDFNKQAEHDTFRNFELEGGTVDGNSIGGKGHVVIGTMPGSSTQTHINLRDITVRRLKVINVPASQTDDTATNHRRHISFTVNHPTVGSSEATQNYIRNILCEDVTCEGGNAGFEANGSGDAIAGINIFLDNIRFIRCSHDRFPDRSFTPNTFVPCVNFQIGSRGFGGRGRIIDCYGYGATDAACETNALEDARVENTVLEGVYGNGFYHGNFNYPAKGGGAAPSSTNNVLDTQHTIYKGCRVDRVASPSTSGSGYRIFRSTPAIDYGAVTWKDCSYYRNGADLNISGDAFYSNAIGRSLKIENCRAVIEGANPSAAGQTETVVRCQNGLLRRLRVDGLHITVRGPNTTTNGATLTGLSLGGSSFDTNPEIDNVTVSYAFTSITGFTCYAIYFGTAATIRRGVIRGLRILDWANSSGWRGIGIEGSATVTLTPSLLIEKCDFTAMTNGNEVHYPSSPNVEKVIYRNNAWRSGSTVLDFASAATLSIPNAPHVKVTGTTGITSITAQPGYTDPVVLRFTGILTVTDGSNLKLNGNLTTAADTQLTLTCDGTNWIEGARSVN